MIHAGQILSDRFEIRRRIGSGGMGEVFEAVDRDRGERVALKTLARADGETIARFKREFRALQSTVHPNLVGLRELGRHGDDWFFTMELIHGRHLLEHVRPREACDFDKLRDGLRQLVTGLRALHVAGLVHRDVKPSNVMVDDAGRAVLLDFGLVTDLDPSRQSQAGGPIGTVEYMAPEQAAGRPVGEAADWYAMGVILYEVLTGRVPHQGHVLQILVDKQGVEPPAPEALAPGAPADLARLCKDLLRIEPAARPDGEEIARRLGMADSPSRPPSPSSQRSVFVGRERELAELHRAAERARDRPVVHLVVGESGIGKSALVARFAHELAEREPGALTLAGRCYERESVPFKAFDAVADALVGHLASRDEAEFAAVLPARPTHLIKLFPVFQRIPAIAAAPAPRHDEGQPHEQRRRMFGALRSLLGSIAAERRVVIAIDDLQWADADSFLLLRELLHRHEPPRVLVLATVRGTAQDADVATRRLEGVTVQRTQVGPLSEAESRALAERVLGRGAGAGAIDVAEVTREAGGHPMFLREILRHLTETKAERAPSITLDGALAARVAQLPGDARAVLEVVCIAGAPLSLDTLARACRLDATRVARAAASLRVASMTREVQRGRELALEPYHDRVRESVTVGLAAPARRELHARIAAALEAGDGARDPQLLLRNFTLAGEPERAARYVEEAAERSAAAHAFDQAADLWCTALDLIPREPDDRRRLHLRAGHALIDAGRGAEAADHFLAAAEGADRPTRLECHRHAAEQLLITGRIAPGIAALDALLAEIGAARPATPRRALASLLRHRAALRLRGLGFRPRSRREVADAELLELDVLKVAAHSLALVDHIRGADFQVRELIGALRTGYRPQIVRALLMESMFQSTASSVRRAKVLLDRAIAIGADDEPYLRAMVMGARGMIAYFTGDAPATVELMAECETVLRPLPGNNWENATARLFHLFGLRFVGDFATMRDLYDRYTAEAAHRGDGYLDSTMRRACVPMWLGEDAPDGAREDLARATWVPDTSSAGFHVQHFHELCARVELCLYTGSPGAPDEQARIADMFERLHRSLLLRVVTMRVQHAYLRGRLSLAGMGPAPEAARFARQLAREPHAAAPVWSMVLRAGVAARAGDRARAAALCGDASAAADRAGMRLTAAAARRREAELRGGEGDDARALAATGEMATLGVRAPARMTSLLVPI